MVVAIMNPLGAVTDYLNLYSNSQDSTSLKILFIALCSSAINQEAVPLPSYFRQILLPLTHCYLTPQDLPMKAYN